MSGVNGGATVLDQKTRAGLLCVQHGTHVEAGTRHS